MNWHENEKTLAGVMCLEKNKNKNKRPVITGRIQGWSLQIVNVRATKIKG